MDTAQMYGNEACVGRAVAESNLPCEDLIVTSKLGNGNHRPDDVRRSLDQSLGELGLEQFDLFLVNWPLPTLCDGDYVATWHAMLEEVRNGRLCSAGVSNGAIPVPKSVRPPRIQENIRLFDFELSSEEMAAIGDALDRGSDGRVGPDPGTFAWIP
ncbi:aldo/keto reductase [Nocardia fusca]|uniref:aldo/keto reductase n=1 Tax=Nocardia fusca TaxID=941183 RepID=UPI00378C9AF2